jgi:Flp pilus assembly protein CpaB
LNRRIAIILALVGLGLAVAGIWFITMILSRATGTQAELTVPTPVTEPVLVAAHAVPLGIVLKAEDLSIVQVPIELAPLNALKSVEEGTGKITSVQLAAGEMIMPHHLIDPTNIANRNLGFALKDDQVLMAFPITDLMSSLNILKRGDVVDILVSVDEEVPTNGNVLASSGEDTQTKKFTFNALQRVEISAVVVDIVQQEETGAPVSEANPLATPQPTPIPDPSQGAPRALMLALSPQDALTLKHLQDGGGAFDLVLRAPTSTQLFESNPVTDDYLIDRYELITIR